MVLGMFPEKQRDFEASRFAAGQTRGFLNCLAEEVFSDWQIFKAETVVWCSRAESFLALFQPEDRSMSSEGDQ